MSDISDRRLALDMLRRDKQEELMGAWDKEVYHPMQRQIMIDCFKEGHSRTTFHSNGLGWSWFYCGKCRGRTNITGPDADTRPDDGSLEN